MPDTIPQDTLGTGADTIDIPVSSSALDSEVKYKAKDSIIFDLVEKKVYLYGNAHVDYKTIQLDAAYITIDYTTNKISARGLPDSTGKLAGMPVFKEGEEEFRPDSMDYNFLTKKGVIYGLRTQEGDGFIHTEKVVTVKSGDKDIIYGREAQYTTCDLPHDPHFYLSTNKLKLIPQEKIITGPAYLVVEGVPIPLVLPFGFFPASSRKTSGIIPPLFGESRTQGFALRGGGFYYGNSDYFDLKLTGDIYTAGGYNLKAGSNYRKRYKYNGYLEVSYARNQFGLKETPDFRVEKNFLVQWTHAQDPKARPGSSFSANVRGGTASYLTSNSYRTNDLFTQTFQSSIAYSKVFTGTPFSLSSSLQHSQNLGTGKMDLTLPQVAFNMSRIYPLRPKAVSTKRWYHDIGITYSSQFQNSLSTSDSTFRQDLDIRNFRNGFSHSIPLSTNFKVLRWFTLAPTIQYTGNIYTRRTITGYDPDLDTLVTTQEDGVFLTHQYNTSMALTTQVFGMLKFRRGKVQAIRHVLIPQISFSYRPDFSKDRYGYYYQARLDSTDKYVKRSYYEGAIYTAPGSGEVGSLGFSFGNNIEMKVRNDQDTANPTKKIKLIESFTIACSYNFLADSFHLNPVSLSAFTTLFERFRIQTGGTLDPYYINDTGRRFKTFALNEAGRLGTLTNGNFVLGGSFNKTGDNYTSMVQQVRNPFVNYYYPQSYASFDVPWNFGFNYNLGYSRVIVTENGVKDYKGRFTQQVSFNGDLSLTRNWKILYNSGYDFTNKEFITSKFTVVRDLHCWQMSFEWIPFGTYRSYFFNIHIKAPALQDLKFDKRREFYDF